MSQASPPGGGIPASPAPLAMVPPPGGWLSPKAPMSHKAALLVGPVTTFYVLMLGALALRVWSRRIKKVPFRLSDCAVFIAATFGTVYFAICWRVATRGNLGYPITRVAVPQRLLIRKAFFWGWLLQSCANTFVRLSILEFLRQIFSSVKKFLYVVYFFESATVAYLLACIIAWSATWRPFKYNWALTPDTPNHCGNLADKFLLSAIFNLVLDVCILILPIPMLWTLQMNARKKIALTVVFGLGIFVCFATAWRTYHVLKFSTPQSQFNFTVTVVEDALWSGLEITLGIINACLPVMQPALQRIFNTQFVRLISFSQIRSRKDSKLSGESSNQPTGHTGFASWVRVGNSKNGSKAGIEREMEYSVDIESDSGHRIPMESMGSTTKLATSNSETYFPTSRNQ